MVYVKTPNLPINTEIVLIGDKYSELTQKPLENMGILPLYIPENPWVDARISGHADLSVVHLGANKIALAPYLKGSGFTRKLEGLGIELKFFHMTQGKEYPNDAGLNLCICGQKLIYNPKVANAAIVEYLTNERGIDALAVKQGYSKCSICVVSENAIITADDGIHKRAVEAGIDSLKITPGYISLPGFDYGFIGGASFKINTNTIAFTGHLDNHPDKTEIMEFLSLHNINIVYITEKPAFDIGSAIQIVENNSYQ